MVGPLRRTGMAVEPDWSARLQPAWPPDNPPTQPTSPSTDRPKRPLHLGKLERVRRYRSMHPSILQACMIMLDGVTTPGCLPPALGAARGGVIHTAPAPRPSVDISNRGYYTSTVAQMAAPEHRRGRTDPVRWRNRPGLGAAGLRGRPRSLRRRAPSGLLARGPRI